MVAYSSSIQIRRTHCELNVRVAIQSFNYDLSSLFFSSTTTYSNIIVANFLHRYDKNLLTFAGKVKKRCFLCRESYSSKSKVTVRDSIEELLKTHPDTSLVSPRAPPTTPRPRGENPDEYQDCSPVPTVAECEEDIFEVDQYATDEFLILNSLGVRSVSEITEDVICKAKHNCQLVLRETLRIAQYKNPSIKSFADMSNSEVRWSTPFKDSKSKEVKSPKSINKARSVASYAESGKQMCEREKFMYYFIDFLFAEADSVSSTETIRLLVKKRSNVPWLHSTIHHGANILSHIVDSAAAHPISAIVGACAIIMYFFHYKETKVFVQEVALGVAKATLKAIVPSSEAIDDH